MSKTRLTSVKLQVDRYNVFKSQTATQEMTFQELANKSLELYILDKDFRDIINTYIYATGSDWVFSGSLHR